LVECKQIELGIAHLHCTGFNVTTQSRSNSAALILGQDEDSTQPWRQMIVPGKIGSA
jgi:hypothetical protein